ncbi:25766_t:CDS:2 [Dentiscutata erythropus]|uniref:25766_t:CDS:1 n=1 Tax=Dentiscutata erythropus TaxID=1348616 RepID=A0A9N9EUF8_9GLOM|nr:25766_t:CDS:2 [Dentiscutata erythropus]
MQLKPCFKIKYDKDGFQTIESWQVFGLQLKCVEQTRDYRHRSNVLQPLETLETTHLNHKDPIQIKSLTLSVNDQNWIIDYSKDELSEKIKRQAYVHAIDYNYIS